MITLLLTTIVTGTGLFSMPVAVSQATFHYNSMESCKTVMERLNDPSVTKNTEGHVTMSASCIEEAGHINVEENGYVKVPMVVPVPGGK